VKPMPVRSIRPRPPSARRLVRTRTEAAAELIRLEHERDRLTQALASLEPRRENARERLKQIDERARQLLGFLEITKADHVANGDVIRPPR
jgi:chromosome segregation ATPase